MSTLADELPRQQERVRGLIEIYAELPNGVGAFTIALMRQALARAERAAAGGDIVEMIRSCKELAEFEE